VNHHYIVLKIVNQASFFTNLDYKMSTRILYVHIKYSMYDLICDVISDQTVKSEEGERQGRGAAAAEFEGRRREDRGAEGAERGRV